MSYKDIFFLSILGWTKQLLWQLGLMPGGKKKNTNQKTNQHFLSAIKLVFSRGDLVIISEKLHLQYCVQPTVVGQSNALPLSLRD